MKALDIGMSGDAEEALSMLAYLDARAATVVDGESVPASQPLRVFQSDYASKAWGYDPGKGHRLIGELTSDTGPVLISVHGVGTDAVIEAPTVERLAARCGLKAYLAFESRSSRWKGLSRISPIHDNSFGLYPQRATYEASLLLLAVADVYSMTAASPLVVAHSRGALILTRAATLWEGLAAVADVKDPERRRGVWMEAPGFLPLWGRLDEGTQRALLSAREAIECTNITAITACPAVPRDDPGWASLRKWAQNRAWNLYTEKDWILFFAGNPVRGYVPLLGDRNIRFRFDHGNFFGNSLVQRVIASLRRHGGLSREIVAMLLRHQFEGRRLAPELSVEPDSGML